MMAKLSFTLFDTILLSGIIQGILCFVFLVLLKEDKRSNRIMGWFILAITLALVKMIFHTQGVWGYSFFSFFPLSIELFPAPLFYLYTLSLENKSHEKIKGFWLYLMPGMLFLLHALVVYFSCLTIDPFEAKSRYAEEVFHFSTLNRIEDIIAILFLFGFGYLAIRKLSRYRRKLVDYSSQDQAKRLKWLLWLFVFLVLTSLYTLLMWLANEFLEYGKDYFWHEQVHHTLLVVLIYFLFLFCLRKMHLIPLNVIKEDLEQDAIEKHRDLSKEFELIEHYMKDQKPYLDPNLSLPDLSVRLDIKSYIISQSIKQHKNSSFRDYINEYRIDEVILKLKDADQSNLSQLGIAYESGFNSEASFYRVFKKITGTSPRSFLKAGKK